MDLDTFKIYGVNAIAFFINLANFDGWIKSFTLVIALGYTTFKALNEYGKWRKNRTGDE